MQTKEPYKLTRGLILSLVALWIWFGLSSGIFAIITGGFAWALLELAFAVGLIILLASGRLLAKAENRPVPFISIAAMTLILTATAVFKVTDLLYARVRQLGEIRIPELVNVISAVGYLPLFIIFAWQLVTSITKRESL